MEEKQYIPEDQWNLPVGYDSDGKPITLRKFSVIKNREDLGFMSEIKKSRTSNLKQLSLDRLNMTKEYAPIVVSGYGTVNIEIAKLAIEDNTDLGQYLMEVELNTVELMIQELSNGDKN